ncbi:WD repeat-containing protein 25 isoform X1 [Patella vulgata]|uniref:WD repeat-containing protein 25 isoform X1 n=1 Tax=Patella vulgata TaxID=6465 RepID=UPI0021805534|nr:WD repeat-containing protein 25 isoform X1 [Patella vulgata]
MDLLKLYENDSDSNSSGDDLGPSEKNVNDNQPQLHSDFFSLQEDDESGVSVTDYSYTKNIYVNGLEIELPQSSFWMSKDSSAQTNSNKKISTTKSISKDEEDTFSTVFLKTVSDVKVTSSQKKDKNVLLGQISDRECKVLPVQECSPFYNTMSNNILKRSADFDIIPERKIIKTVSISAPNTKEINPNNKEKPERRNIFFIHGKIAPLLNKTFQYKCPHKVEREWAGHNQAINRICWNNANYSHLALSASMDKTIQVWNVWSSFDSCVQTLTVHDKAVKDAAWDSSGQKILSCGYDRSCVLTCVQTGSVIKRLDHDGYVFCCKYHPCNPNLIITGSTNRILSWDLRIPDNPVSQFTYKDKLGQIQDLLFSHNGETVFSCSDVVTQNSSDKNIMAWDFKTTSILSNQIYEERYTCNRLKLHPQDANSFLAQSQGGYIAIFSTNRPFKMNKSKRFEGHKLLGRNIGFDISSDGDIVISGSCDKTLYCYSYKTGKPFKTIETTLDYTDVAFHPVLASTVLTSSWNGQLELLH